MTDLQALRDKYESHIKQLSDFCNRCTRENSRRTKLITELHRFEKNQKEKQVQLNQKIQVRWICILHLVVFVVHHTKRQRE